METRETLVKIMEQKGTKVIKDEALSFSLPKIRINKKEGEEGAGPKLYIRDDGTVDWEGALDDRDALKNLGISLWARINGQDPDSVSEESVNEEGGGHHAEKAVTVKIEETEEIRRERATLERLRKEYKEMESEHLKLLNSGEYKIAGCILMNTRSINSNPRILSAKLSPLANRLRTSILRFSNLTFDIASKNRLKRWPTRRRRFNSKA